MSDKRQNILAIITWFKEKNYPDNFIIGLLGNWECETAHTFNPKVVQLSAKVDNETYINAVDNGTYSIVKNGKTCDFTTDGYGVGLAQWTSSGRKARLLEYAKSKGKSVGDLITQLEFVDTEIHLTGYATCRKALYENWSIEDCTRIICEQYERPYSMQVGGETKENAIQKRIEYALNIQKEYFTEQESEDDMCKKIAIMLDAGHDGKRNQSPVYKNYYESDFAWKLQNYLKTELEKYGFIVGTTRATQATVMDVVARGKKAKGYDLFLSLHSNACGTESVRRVSGIFLAKDDTTGIDEVSERISVLLTDVIKRAMGIAQASKNYHKLAGYDRNGNGITSDDDYYGVLYGSHLVGTAGIILEHSFHTNTESAKWLYKDENIKALAVAESKALADYYGLTATETKQTEQAEVKENVTETVTYKVVKGDTLSKIANAYNTTIAEIMALNPIITNKSVISVGWKLTIPVNSSLSKESKRISTYTVKSGDGLIKIAKALKEQGTNVTWLEIAKANGISVPYVLKVGQVLIIP